MPINYIATVALLYREFLVIEMNLNKTWDQYCPNYTQPGIQWKTQSSNQS